ncbi:hypothetical protein JMJ77_0012995 [Colletotrichum scovillei]|uniref:Uncharacterized protein n=1 Tax=Colletotrichum scovillei TaxID=1209932 RepID=A0A9P7R6M5_9PEZI|nr:hypothetical protein JMJ77_0012995 [Colletotrichum scovillei]KAG7069282.1 hypothetical protein JMJ76_0002955 [Colletotrichum scovillei]KAG7073199.1 hypothetical protein JMJ78_0014178 [Colletotrichum scovillei]
MSPTEQWAVRPTGFEDGAPRAPPRPVVTVTSDDTANWERRGRGRLDDPCRDAGSPLRHSPIRTLRRRCAVVLFRGSVAIIYSPPGLPSHRMAFFLAEVCTGQ